jgi:hypothetical protein
VAFAFERDFLAAIDLLLVIGLLRPVRVGCYAVRGLTDTSNETDQNRHELAKAATVGQ